MALGTCAKHPPPKHPPQSTPPPEQHPSNIQTCVALKLFWWCVGAALELFWCCSGAFFLWLLWNCVASCKHEF